MVGNVIATTVRIWIRNLPRFLVLTVLAYVPILGWNFLLAIDGVGEFVHEHFYAPFMGLHPSLRNEPPSASWIPLALLAGAIAVCTVGRMREQKVSIWRGAATALRWAPWLIAIAFIVQLSTVGVSTLVEIALWESDRRFASRSLLSMVGYGLLWIVCVSVLIAAKPAAVVERRGVLSSLARAWRLARGRRLEVLAVLFVHYVLVTAIYYALFVLLIVRNDRFDDDLWMIYAFVRLGLQLVLAPLYAILAAVIFERLRAEKEGPAKTQLDAVFD